MLNRFYAIIGLRRFYFMNKRADFNIDICYNNQLLFL